MTNQEFSDEFDVLYNNITSNQAPGLDEYEKSVFLTKAQDEILKSYFNPILNKSQVGVDGNEQRQIDFSMLIKTVDLDLDSSEASTFSRLDSRSMFFSFPDDAIMVLNEMLLIDGRRMVVVPINYLEYNRLMSKPYKRPLKQQAWRLLYNSNTSSSAGALSYLKYAEVIPGPNDDMDSSSVSYTVRYIKRPQAIILYDLEGVTIGGSAEAQGCELDPVLHSEILQRAVELAKAAWAGGLDSQIALGSGSETRMGVSQTSRG